MDGQQAAYAKRREFGAFLKSRRDRLHPDDVGLANGFRRRTPGLRREEVAMLAGVGTTWYTWLEQGREVRPSHEVLVALAKTLKLNDAERRYLFELAGRPAPDSGPLAQVPAAPMLRMLRQLTNQPAYILGPRWDILAWNAAASALFGDYSKLDGDERNIMYMMFNNPDHKTMLTDWSEIAPTVLGMFRADCAPFAGNPDHDRLIATLLRESPDFRYWWKRHDVERYTSVNKRIRHPVAGPMVFEYNAFTSDDGHRMKLVVYTPLEQEDTIKKIETLMQGLPTLTDATVPAPASSQRDANS